MYFELALLAYLADYFFGELPGKHPVMWMGDWIGGFERRFYRDSIWRGGWLVLSLIFITAVVSGIWLFALAQLPVGLSLPLLALSASTGLAMNLLHRSVAAILTAEQPRQAISYLVSRDTAQMTEADVYKAAIETWAENLSDGVIAPLFYLILFGLPGIAIYKAINTMDSMVGYKTPRYERFGKVAARLDDVANYLPARLTAGLIVLLADDKRLAWRCLWRDGHKLESPNAGRPIAAMAGALGVALGGDTYYHGQLKHKPQLGEALHPLDRFALQRALALRVRLDACIMAGLALAVLWL